jgi:ribosomal protein S4
MRIGRREKQWKKNFLKKVSSDDLLDGYYEIGQTKRFLFKYLEGRLYREMLRGRELVLKRS